MMNPLTEGIIRYSLFSKWRQNKSTAMQHYFPDNEVDQINVTTPWMQFGSLVAKNLEQRPLPDWLADITVYDVNEYQIVREIGGIKFRGSLDTFRFEDCAFADHKSTKAKYTTKEAEKHREQLTFYSVLVQDAHGKVNDLTHIIQIPVDMNENGFVTRTGEPENKIPVTITQHERDAMRAEMVRVGKEIMAVYDAYKRGEVKF
jgi:hypothetical protein